jgi:hypothetical protein
MTRKDYELIAEHLRIAETDVTMRVHYRSDSQWKFAVLATAAMIDAVADALAYDNSKFDRERFMKAARVDVSKMAPAKAKFLQASTTRINQPRHQVNR